ncbi:PGF-CTERM sorting domain-containing protein [Halorussus halophilus]|uniref:PGF-CTERM sorting domain-containing protein n=1 Tax=Halorussus halophilus TaxID=2650975 RepID=UPI0013017645|nr:PGF-CTERM sorting domain-containing protein [Halorussus halophilus]
MRVRSAVVFGIVVSALCLAPITVSAASSNTASAGVVSLAPITAQDGMNETTTGDGMGNETMVDETTMGNDSSMANETSMGNETMDDSMNETTMSDGNMSDGMDETTMANSTETMDDSMETTSDEMGDTTAMDDDNSTANDGDDSGAFAPGFGVVTVLLAFVAIVLYAARGR